MDKSKQTTLIGQATEDQINKWKEENPLGIYGVVKDGHVGYFKYPSRQEVNAGLSKFDPESPLDVYEDIAYATHIGGSEELLKNDRLFNSAIQRIKQEVDGEPAEVLKL